MYSYLKLSLRNTIKEEYYNKLKLEYQKSKGFFRVLPDFIIVGAMKGGTSSLYSYLSSHPQVLPSLTKEVHFFDNNFDKGVYWYRRFFPTKFRMIGSDFVTGESSPYYLYHPHTARRIHEVIPEVKIVILLRDPVERAISHYWDMVNIGLEDLPMKQAFKKENERIKNEKEKIRHNSQYKSFNHQMYSYLDRGKYLEQVERYIKYFGNDNIKLLKSKQLFEDTQKTFRRVTRFLGISRYDLESPEIKNESVYYKETPRCVKDMLEEYYRDQKNKIESGLGISFR